MRIPAEHFDDARAQVRTIAKAVEQATVEARDVTREDVNQEASLRNFRAEEAQYLAILKRATAHGGQDVLEVSSKLAEVRGRIEEGEADLRLLHHQVEMSLLTTNNANSMVALFFESSCDSDMGFHPRCSAKSRMVNATAYRAAVLSRTNHLVASSRAKSVVADAQQVGLSTT